MKIIAERTLIQNIIAGWKTTHPAQVGYDLHEKILKQLLDLEINEKTRSVLTNLFENSNFLRPLTCDECKKELEILIHLGDDPKKINGNSVHLCQSCLASANKLIDKNTWKPANTAPIDKRRILIKTKSGNIQTSFWTVGGFYLGEGDRYNPGAYKYDENDIEGWKDL